MVSKLRSLLLITALLVSFFVVGCSDDATLRLYTDPISGEEIIFESVENDGWTLYSGHEGRMIILSKGESPILYVMDTKSGREITIHSSPTILGAVWVEDEDYDGEYDRIKYRNDKVEVSDILMDGEIESILDYETESMRINYQGKFHQLLGKESEKYILVNSERIDLKRENNQFVPVETPTPNKALNADP